MQKNRLIAIFIFTTLLAACKSEGSAAGNADSGSGGGGGTSDTTAPIIGPAVILISGISDTGVTVSWGAASDAVTSAANLQYRLVRAATSAAIDTIAKVDAAAAGVTVVDNYTANLTTRNVTGLTDSTTYFFALVVRDAAGNKAIYAPVSTTTSAAGTTASPVLNPAPGTFGTAPNLQMTSATVGAAICYATGATTPVCDAPKTGCTTGTLYTAPISVTVTATYKAIACKTGNTDSSQTSGLYTIDTTAPTVASTTPANSATGVSTGSTIAVTFSEAMTPSTLKAATTTSCLTDSPTIQVSTNDFANCIPMTSATLSTSDNITFTMTPASALSTFTVYKIRVKTGAQDAVGNAIASEYTSANGFTTALAGALTISTFTPISGTYNSAQSAAVTTTETGAKICYRTDGTDPAATTPGTCDGPAVEVNEGQAIAVATTMTLKVIATKVGHTNSVVTARNYTISPTVTGTSPANGDTGVDPAGTIGIAFSKTMNRSSFSFNAAAGACTGNIQVSADSFTTCIGFTIPAGNATTFTLTPAATLASAATYKVKVTTGVTDSSGNAATAFEQATGFTTRYYRTEPIDGTNNFVAGETFTTSSGGYSAYVTWDSTYVYIGYNGADVSSGTSTKWVMLYLGDSSGSSTGVTYNTQTPTFPTGFNAKYHIRWKADNTYTNAQTYTAAWADAAWDFTGDVFRTGSFVEFRIPRADIGSPTTLKVIVNMINEQGGGEWTYGLAPSAGFTDGYAANPAKYLSCNLNSSSAPTTSCSVLP